jgi:hypothetical protein
MSTETWLWVALAITAVVYYWVGRNIVGQPTWSYPRLFRGRGSRTIAVLVPLVAFVGVIAIAFLYTDQGWWVLAVSAAIFFLLAVRPHSDLLGVNRHSDPGQNIIEDDPIAGLVANARRESDLAYGYVFQQTIRSGDLELFSRFLKEHKNLIDSKIIDVQHPPHDWTLLQFIASLGRETRPVHLRMAKELIELGANVNCRTVLEWTPVHIIAMTGQDEASDLLRLLIAHGADVGAVDHQGLDWRFYWQHGQEIRFILDSAMTQAQKETNDLNLSRQFITKR